MRIAALAVLLAACSVEKGSGVMFTDTRSFGEASAIELSTFLDVEVQTGVGIRAIDITCDDNLLPHILTEVRGNRLVIKNEEGHVLKPSSRCHAEIKIPDAEELRVSGSGALLVLDPLETLDRVRVSGSGSVELGAVSTCGLELDVSGSGHIAIAELDACEVEAEVSGSGHVEVRGDATAIDARVSGSGDVHAGSLETDLLVARVSGSGSVEGVAHVSAEVRISGSGDVRLREEPDQITTDISGSGSLSFGL